MHRVHALRHPTLHRGAAHVVTYSFASGTRTESFMRLFTQHKQTYLTRRIGSVPNSPVMMVANVYGRGSWVAFLKRSDTSEHGVFQGWSKKQVSHAWQACNGEVLIDCKLRALLRQLLDYHYPPEALGPVTWQSTEDVMCMMDVNNHRNSPCTLIGKRPFKCPSTDQKQLGDYLLGMHSVYTTLNTYRKITNGY